MNEKINYENHLAIIQGENINVSSSNDAKDFFILLTGLAVVILLFLSFFNVIASFCIDNISVENQLKIESLLRLKVPSNKLIYDKKQLKYITNIKQKIVNEDVNLQNKSDFQISFLRTKDINAMIAPNGSIYITKGLLDMNLSEQELAFILSHELGHYAHRDHLKTISKQIAFIIVFSLINQDKVVSSITDGISQMEILNHSREQEKNADLYASNMLIKLYGTNIGAKSFINKIKDKEKTPEFLYYFSTHPSWNKRLEIINSNK